jgi:WD40 repeat protein
VNLWDGVTGKEKVTLTNSGDTFHCLAISPDGKILAGGNTWKNGIRLWDLATGHELANLEVSEGGIGQRIAFSPDGKTLATGSARSMTVHLFDVAGGNERAALKGRPGAARCLAFSPDGKTLACGGYLDTGKQPPVEGQMMLWDLTTGKEKRAAEGHIGHVRSVAFSPDGKFLASGGSDQLVKFWDVAEGHEQAILKGHKAVVTCVAFSPDGKTLASGSTDGEVKLWDVSVKEAK